MTIKKALALAGIVGALASPVATVAAAEVDSPARSQNACLSDETSAISQIEKHPELRRVLIQQGDPGCPAYRHVLKSLKIPPPVSVK